MQETIQHGNISEKFLAQTNCQKGYREKKYANTNDIENFLTLNSINMKCQFKFALFNPLTPKND